MVDIAREIIIIANVVAVRHDHSVRADSSAGEHLPYTQGVVGSKPIPPTITTAVESGAVAQSG